MERRWPIKLIHIVAISAASSIAAHRTAVQAAPIFYVSNQNAGATPGLLDLTVAPNSTGTLHIWADSDVRLTGVSLDLIETGGAIKFTGLDVPNPDNRWWFLDGPQVITTSSVTSIGGATLPGIYGGGIGRGSLQGDRVLLASVNYTAFAAGTSQLSLRVGKNGIAEWSELWPFATFRFGTEGAPLVYGNPIHSRASGGVGFISIANPEPSTAMLLVSGLVGALGFARRRYSTLSPCDCDAFWVSR
jgi:hypothetical protein